MIRRAALTAAVAIATALTQVPAATAGTYEVLACSLASGTNLAWTFQTNYPAGIRYTDRCASDLEDDADSFSTFARALGIRTLLGAPDMPVGTYAYLRIDVPNGLTITGTRDGGKGHTSNGSWQLAWETSALLDDVACQLSDGCPATPGTQPVAPSMNPLEPAQWVRYGFRCTQAPCDAGASAHAAAARLYGAAVQVTDAIAPAAGLAGVPTSLTAGQALVASVSGSDQTGVRRLELLVDGVVVATSDRACDWRLVLPCESPGGQVTASLQTSVGIGSHQVIARATDAAGNVASSAPQTVTVTAPGGGTPTPVVTPSPRPTATPTTRPLRSPQLRIRSVSRAGSSVRVRGQVAASCGSRIRVRVTAGGRSRTSSLTAPTSGRWGVTIRGVRRTGKLTVRVEARASMACRAALAKR